jgi:hypothetical protein
MKNPMRIALMAGAALALSAGAASAQGWTNLDQRQAMLDDRIDAGVRSGDLSREEAMRLRAEFRELERLEARYRVDGLSTWERQDLDRRFDQLALQIRAERRDYDRRGVDVADVLGWFGGRGWTDERGQWVSIDRRQEQLDRRIDQGVRSGQLTRAEAARLRAEFDDLARMEAAYRRDGLTLAEREALDERFDRLATRIRIERRDDDRRYGRWDDDDRRYGRREDDWGRWFGGDDWRDDRGRWVSLDRRKMQLDRRIERGLQNGQLTSAEAARLRAEFAQLLRVEARYRRNGFTEWEMADLDRRFDTLAAAIRFERNDRDRQFGYYRR